MEGRVQHALRAVFPPGDAREDWTIMRALGEALGIILPYDNMAQLQARMAAEWPALAQAARADAFIPAEWQATSLSAPLPSGPAVPPQTDFYSSNPIARASPTMRACVAEILEGRAPMLEAAE